MSDYIFVATLYCANIVVITSVLLLIINMKKGDRSRLFLAGITSISLLNYIPPLFEGLNGDTSTNVITVPKLIVAIFMVLTYLIYPIDVISPGWLNLKRLFQLYSPIAILLSIFFISKELGCTYEEYNSLLHMWPDVSQFNVIFSYFICLLFVTIIFIIFFIPYTQKYNGTNRSWLTVYIILYLLGSCSYLLLIGFNDKIMAIIYLHISIFTIIVRTYMELKYRIVRSRNSELLNIKESDVSVNSEINSLKELIEKRDECDKKRKEERILIIKEGQSREKGALLFQQLQRYMNDNKAWREPDISINKVAAELCTNRTTLYYCIKENGYDSYPAYVNSLRLLDFISIVQSHTTLNYMDAFFDAGFRSKSTAFKCFKQMTGSTPTEYFISQQDRL